MKEPQSKLFKFNEFITVVFDGKQYTVTADNPNFEQTQAAFLAQDWTAVFDNIQIINAIKRASTMHKDIEVTDTQVFFKGVEVHGVIVDRILDFIKTGADFTYLVRFLEKLHLNPSSRAVEELYGFLEHRNLPITQNGNFMAYKGLRPDYFSCHAGKAVLIQGKTSESGQIYNGVGCTIEMQRNQVDDNRDHYCSYGLHAGSLDYATNFGQITVLVEINPADVVSIPRDYNSQKLRTCKYVVIADYERPLENGLYTSNYDEKCYDDCELDCACGPDFTDDDGVDLNEDCLYSLKSTVLERASDYLWKFNYYDEGFWPVGVKPEAIHAVLPLNHEYFIELQDATSIQQFTEVWDDDGCLITETGLYQIETANYKDNTAQNVWKFKFIDCCFYGQNNSKISYDEVTSVKETHSDV